MKFLLDTEASTQGLSGVHIYSLLPGLVYNSEGKKKKLETMSAFPLFNIIDQIICLCPYKRTEKRV